MEHWGTAGLVLGAGLICAGAAEAWVMDAPHVATGFMAHIMCSAAFVSGLDPYRVSDETRRVMPGVGLIGWALTPSVDRGRREVTVRLMGLAQSRAVFRDGMGCYVDNGGTPPSRPASAAAVPPALLPAIAGPDIVAPTNPALAAALDHAFGEDRDPLRQTKAVLVLKRGRIVAERYAPGYGIDTPLPGWSMTKSVTNALVGILVRQGRLVLRGPVPVAAWQAPGDPRGRITADQLLRHTAGLALGNSLTATLASAADPVNRMKYVEPDMAAFAERAQLRAAPGTTWTYSDGNYLILSRLIRDATGGHAADVDAFARRELFGPLGMEHVTQELDVTGTPEGASQMFAPARAWARFGQLYLNDGMAGSRRILPEGWVAYSTEPTPGAWVGYGAGFWTNLDDSEGARGRIAWGMPPDAFHARGQFGQYVVVVPSEQLVIVRLGISGGGGDPEGTSRLVDEVVAATHGRGADTQGSAGSGRPPCPSPACPRPSCPSCRARPAFARVSRPRAAGAAPRHAPVADRDDAPYCDAAPHGRGDS